MAARLRLEALAAGDGRGESGHRAAEGHDFAEMAAGIGIAAPQRAFGVVALAVVRMRPDGADIGEAEHVLQPVAIAQRLAEQLAGVEEQHRSRRIDLGHMMEQHHGFGGKG